MLNEDKNKSMYNKIMSKISKALRYSLNDLLDDNIPDTINTDDYVGKIFYKNGKPFAICVAEGLNFKDGIPRYMLIYEQKQDVLWMIEKTNITRINNKKYKKIKMPYQFSSKAIMNIDYKGYSNTKHAINSELLNILPAYKYCISLDKNCYLPAIDELEYMFINKDVINEILKDLNAPLILPEPYWSSTEYSNENTLYIHMDYPFIRYMAKRKADYTVRPFIKIYND